MFKFIAVVFAAILAVAFAAPGPKPGVLAYSAPAVAYSAPLAIPAAGPSLVSGYSAQVVSPYAYSAYAPGAVYV